MNTQKLTPKEWQMFEDYLLGLDPQGLDDFKHQMKEDAYQQYPGLKEQQEVA